jgi:GNAT superfamily N-acetyltransferase
MHNSDIVINRVRNESDKSLFIKFPWKIYKGDKNWVPPLIFDVKKNLDTRRNPFYTHSEIELFLAYKNGELCGRIAAITNEHHNKFHSDKVGFFGYFESVNDKDVAIELFKAAEEFLKSKGKDTIRGPVNPSTNDEVALLIDGFDRPPVLLMTYNPEYYAALIENSGFVKAKDMYAYMVYDSVTKDEKVMGKLRRVSEIVQKKEKIKIRTLNMQDFKNELQRVKEVYNQAWSYNWGFVPMTEKEFDYLSDSMKPILDKDLVYFAEVEGKPIGFSLAIPDMNVVFKKINGRIFPFGIIKILLGRKKINRLRLITLGVIPEYQRKGIESIFINNTIEIGMGKGYNQAEISWILEDNTPMVQTAIKLGAEKSKTYRIYDKIIS